VNIMTSAMKEAIEVLKGLSEEKQDTAARAILDYASQGRVRLSDEQVAEVKRRMAKKDRKFVSVAEARKRLRHFGV
jgi:hypothetical protein